jgi:nucleoside triphosphate pyrophosphatase
MRNINQSCPTILASNSPRRRDLLERAGLKFETIPSQVDESRIELTKPEIYTRVLAEAKARDVARAYPDHWVIGADTIVLVENTILGKPHSEEDARGMLRQLSGRTHQVLTAYAVICRDQDHFFAETITTAVHFKRLTDDEIEWYIQTGEPFDKAGAYAIQGIGAFLVRGINGSYTNVVGLPVCELLEHLLKAGVVKLAID